MAAPTPASGDAAPKERMGGVRRDGRFHAGTERVVVAPAPAQPCHAPSCLGHTHSVHWRESIGPSAAVGRGCTCSSACANLRAICLTNGQGQGHHWVPNGLPSIHRKPAGGSITPAWSWGDRDTASGDTDCFILLIHAIATPTQLPRPHASLSPLS